LRSSWATHAAALRLYDTQVWGVVKDYSQDQIGAVSLLARLELAGVDVGSRWQDVADHLAARVHDHVLPFLDLQYLYGLARAGRPEAATLLGSIEAHCLGIAPAQSAAPDATVIDDVWLKVCLPASRGLVAHAQGRHPEAVEALGAALPRLLEIGGSHAQRDLFAQIHLDALMQSGQWGLDDHHRHLRRMQHLVGHRPEQRAAHGTDTPRAHDDHVAPEAFSDIHDGVGRVSGGDLALVDHPFLQQQGFGTLDRVHTGSGADTLEDFAIGRHHHLVQGGRLLDVRQHQGG
jgi:hypothetical protein